MFLYNDPHAQLDISHQRAEEFIRTAAAYRLARGLLGRRRRLGRWPRRVGPDGGPVTS
jgi:hypothetical protein